MIVARNAPASPGIEPVRGVGEEEYVMRHVVKLVLVASAIFVAACNTVEGAGRDLQSAGSTVANTADDAK